MRFFVGKGRRLLGFLAAKKGAIFWMFGGVVVLVVVGGGLLGIWVGVQARKTVVAGRSLYGVIMNDQPEEFEASYGVWMGELGRLKGRALVLDRVTGGILEKKFGLKENLARTEALSEELPRLLGREGKRTYLVLLQNNMELRPSGGFMGSYAKVKFDRGGLVDLAIQDIYVPDGQMKGHVEPPWPIQEAFGQGWWKLRDANWDADFPTAAQAIEWFFEKGGEEKADGIVAINLSLVEDLLKIVGPVRLLDFDRVVTAENLYEVAQYYAEANFFPGSTQKKDILGAVGKALIVELRRVNGWETVKLLGAARRGLEERQILVYVGDERLEGLVAEWGWGGAMKRWSKEGRINDYLYLVETNLGANKANCCIRRKVRQEVDLSDEMVARERLMVEYENLEGGSWGGDYNNFLRVYLPMEARVLSIRVGGEEVAEDRRLVDKREKLGITGVGFFVRVPKGEKGNVEVVYELLREGDAAGYRLEIQKQPGIGSLNYELGIKDKKGFRELKKDLRKDEVIDVE